MRYLNYRRPLLCTDGFPSSSTLATLDPLPSLLSSSEPSLTVPPVIAPLPVQGLTYRPILFFSLLRLISPLA
jgi:hypothetical protein